MEKVTISRRQFLGGMFCLTCLPAKLFAADKDDIILRMAVMSDVHIYLTHPIAVPIPRLQKGLKFLYDWSETQSYKNVDALIVAGDMTDHGTPDELNLFKETMDAEIRPGTAKLLCMGNHEFYRGSHQVWMETLGVKDNERYEINGHSIIALSPETGNSKDGDYLYKMDWLREQLEAAKQADPKKPIFLFQHYHITDTVYGSCLANGDDCGIADLKELLDQYPQVIDFSGHSHYPVNDPRSAWQGNFTAFGTGSLSYFEMEGGHYDQYPVNHGLAAQFYIVEVHADHSVVVRPFDILSGEFFDHVYVVAEPGNADKYLYTDRRYETAKPPVWKEGTQIKIENRTYCGGTLVFPQAEDETAVHSYRVDITKETEDGEEQTAPVYQWSEYYLHPMPDPMRLTLETLEPESRYHLAVTAINPFRKESAEKLEIILETLDDTDTSDHSADQPAANLMAVAFTGGKITNEAAGIREFEGRKIQIIGKPAVLSDKSINAYAGVFDGKNDYLKYPFANSDEARTRQQVTLGARFFFDRWENEKQAIFSNKENKGGYSFELNPETKQLEFWLYLDNEAQTLAVPCEANVWHTVFGVYDGKEMILYFDGREVVRKEIAGSITYTHNTDAKAIMVGADINERGNGNCLFKGKIAFARLYNWALNSKQVQSFENK